MNNKATENAVLIVAIVTSFVVTFAGSALNIAAPSIGMEFHTKASLLGWIMTAFMLCVVAFSLPFGRLADITSRKKVLVIGVAIFGFFSIVALFANSFEILILLRVLQGLGGAMISATNMAILVDAFPREKRGRVIGITVASTYIGLSAGPIIGGVITHYLGWRFIFVAAALLAVFSFIMAATKLPSGTHDEGAQFPSTGGVAEGRGGLPEKSSIRKQLNPIGSLLYIVAILFFMYGLTSFTQNVLSYVFTAVGIVLLVLFVRNELRTERPILEVRLFKSNINYLLSNLAALFNYAATFAISYLVSIYLQVVMGYDASITGIILITQPLLQAICSPFSGRLSDRKSPYLIASIGMALCAVSLFSYIFVGADSGLAHVVINLVVVGVGFGLFSSPNTNAIMSCVPPKDYSVASSVTSTMRSMGQVISMAIITIIMNAYMGATPIDEAGDASIIGSMQVAFTVFCALCVLGIFLSLGRKQNGSSETKE
ncbi:MAG: MFS transporter [Clostridiales Family XIII bacterium]|nr:MFS transporter [Clostridiales Family XIII bacterium]